MSPDGRNWFLLNASPDLRTQIEATPELCPQNAGRNSPIAGVVITSGDIDQIAGLLSLRELQPFVISCTGSIRRILQEDNSMFGMLNRTPDQVKWNEIHPGQEFPLAADGSESGIIVTAFSLGSRYPAYISRNRAQSLKPEEALLGLILTSSSGKRLAYMPAAPTVDDALLGRLKDVDLLLFDGTFWSDDELIRIQGTGATAREMGHIPVSGPEGSLRKLAGLKRPRKIFFHVNNTNPMLDESGPEYREARAAGWEVAEDGWSFDL